MSLRAQRSNLVVGSNYIASYFSPHPEIATVACGDLAMTWRSKNILIAIADLGVAVKPLTLSRKVDKFN